MLDRQALARWLSEPRRTFRWHPEGGAGAEERDSDRYEGVEVGPRGLRWFRWSHEPADGGRAGEEIQPLRDFHVDGPARFVPPAVLAELRAFLGEHGL